MSVCFNDNVVSQPHSTVLRPSWQSTVGEPDHACIFRRRELINLKAVPDCGSRAGTQPGQLRGELRSDRSLSKFGCICERDERWDRV